MDHVDEEIEIPNYFLCPISLEIMKDPVTTVTGITYDRQSIVQWLEKVPSCPVTKQPLPLDSDLTPNHTLRRLIQHWCVENATHGVVTIPTPRAPPGKLNVLEEIKNLKKFGVEALGREETLKKFEVLATEGERNRRMMCEEGLDESLRLLHLIGVPLNDAGTILNENDQILESLTLILHQQDFINKAYTIVLLRNLTGNASSHIVERFGAEVFKGIIEIMKDPVTTVTGITYDRQSIVQWLEKVPSCPVTKQPLPLDSDLTPNHTLRRLIQHWCVENATHGVVTIPTPRAPPGSLTSSRRSRISKSLE
ncbi:hypothetical protein Bca52824_021112 [Brassica carinata]|uniref:U-box domain-containing protein n=1 Tax=Brassica carinata TaxID=52824 RepID=A0A8X7VVU7_BRACI|nr:hypothetical protein Bca52824_021112 [Brassica carinata]